MSLKKILLNLSNCYSQQYLVDMADLQCLLPTHQPRVSKHMEQIKDMITQLKQEMFKPACSIKNKPVVTMLGDVERKTLFLQEKTTVIESTSGNIRTSMAFMAAMKGYKMVLTMPSYTSMERRVTMRTFGVDLILADPTKRLGGTVKKAHELLESTPNSFMLQQLSNPAQQQLPDSEQLQAATSFNTGERENK